MTKEKLQKLIDAKAIVYGKSQFALSPTPVWNKIQLGENTIIDGSWLRVGLMCGKDKNELFVLASYPLKDIKSNPPTRR